ncbi:alpha/beta-hydrolase [Lophiostoma macrostomum CBS 122681]|uniref:Alpha/beta-hydrolase n=1 Tax=Lophiostoma macrostomum CBS 122681 TaxID=1314788 RepID=A0A6A6T558_9PLEO|nr:alpha/beta-hydrolase [Lophiostoma macrostomum CBS 122681]
MPYHSSWNIGLQLAAGGLALSILLYSSRNVLGSDAPKTIPSPLATLLPHLSEEGLKSLPYPPDALPGARDVDTPYGCMRVYEWGPEKGHKVLLIHGISTPSIALGKLAHNLVERGCRVMLFDLFGRGLSSSPVPSTTPFSSALYTSQISLVLQSSPLHWCPITLIGYSLGGAISADFTSYFPDLVSNLILIAPGGLIRTNHISWKSRLMYGSEGWIPESLIERIVGRRLWTGPEAARAVEPEPDLSQSTNKDRHGESKGGLRAKAVYQSSNHRLLPHNPSSTVGGVVDWQIQHHRGFVPAFISSIRHAPIHDQHTRWRIIGADMARRAQEGKEGMKEVHVVLGAKDPIIIAEELIADAKEVLGEEFVKFKTLADAGHDVAIERADEIAELVSDVLDGKGANAMILLHRRKRHRY